MKKILLLCIILLFGQISFAQNSFDSYVPADLVILERIRPEGEQKEQPLEPKTEMQIDEPKTKTPQTQKPKKSNKPTYPNLKIYNKPKNEPCQSCYYEYKGEIKKPKKTSTVKRKKAMTKKEKEQANKEILEKINNGKIPPLFSIQKNKAKMKKHCEQ